MNLEQVAHYIAHPHELGLAEAPVLKTMSEKHPYAAVFSLLYLTALANGKSVDLDDALQQHAYRLSDRTKLYHLLHGESEVVVAGTMAVVEEDAQSSLPKALGEGGSRGRIDIAPQDIQQPVPEKNTQTEIPVEESSSETVSEITEEDNTLILPLNPPPKGETEETPLETDFDRITEAFTREQHFEVEPQEEDQAIETENILAEEQEYTEEETEEVVIPEEIREEILPPAPPSPSALGRETETATEPKRSFTSWLKSSDHAAEAQVEEDTSKTERATLIVPISNDSEQEPLKRSVDAIIDNFIKEEPTITRGKTEFFSPSRKAKESLDEEAVPVSETLAKIFAAQGNYPKAIHVYHQLMLSFPEKKSFFAIQIEALKKKITS